jgi:hypothetical protein
VAVTIQRAMLRAAAFACAALALALVSAQPGYAQRAGTKFDGLRQCERFGVLQFRKHNPGFRRFLIDRATVSEDRFVDQVGQQFVSTIYHGRATYEAAAGPKPVRFICLHAGYRRGPVFVYTLPE